MNKVENMKKFFILQELLKMKSPGTLFGGGGNREEVRDIVRGVGEAAKQLGSEVVRVGRHCYADSETKVVSEIKDDRAIRREDDKSETEAISRHSEVRQTRKNPADSNLIQLQGISINSTETDHASKLLGIFASKYDVGIAMPTYFKDLAVKRVAFTLAEVLITLGIIGVVASLTLPSVINKYRAFVLEQQFKKSYSNLSQTIIDMKRDSGLEHLRDNYVRYDTNSGYDSTLVKAFYDSFDSHIAPVDKLKKLYSVTNYSGTGTSATNYGNDWPRALFVLADGSSVGRQVNNGCLRFWIDTNGPYKKPNRYGFDIFELRVCDSTDALKPVKAYKNNYTDEELEKEQFPYIAGAPCTKNSKQLLNGIGCSWYALNNINPDDNSKKYWDSLPW